MDNGYDVNEFINRIGNNQKAIQAYKEMQDIMHLYSSAIKEIRTKLEILDDEFSVKYKYNPIHNIESRLKTPMSILEKLRRKGYEISLESAKENLFDIAGIRVVCNYVDDVYRIADLLVGQADVTQIKRKDYIVNPKPNGYRSLHVVVKVPIFLAEETVDVPVEVQIRTIAMDMWATLEHQLKYKTDNEVNKNLQTKLRFCADRLNAIDSEMQEIYEEIKIENKDKK